LSRNLNRLKTNPNRSRVQVQIFNLSSKGSSSNSSVVYQKYLAFKKRVEDPNRIQVLSLKDFGRNNLPFNFIISFKLIITQQNTNDLASELESNSNLDIKFHHATYTSEQQAIIRKIPEFFEKYQEDKLLEYRNLLVGNSLKNFLFNMNQFSKLRTIIMNSSLFTGGNYK
jgi:hypothetical protein